MKIKEALLAKHDEVIDTITGKLIKVWPLRAQSQAQAKHDIYPQDIELEDENGQALKVQIIRKAMHLPPEDRGKTFTFASTATERGPDGLRMNIYKPEGKDAVVRVVASQHCSIKVVADIVQEKQGAQEKTDFLPTQNGDCVEHRVKLYLDIYDVVRSEHDKRYGGEDDEDTGDRAYGNQLTNDNIKDVTTTIFLSFKGDYGKYAPPVFAADVRVNPTPKSDATPAQEAKPVQRDPGKVIEAIITDTKQGKLDIERAAKALASLGVTWEKMYDHLTEGLRLTFSQVEIDQAHDSLRAMVQSASPKMTEEDFYRTLFVDYTSFYEEIQSMSANSDEVPM